MQDLLERLMEGVNPEEQNQSDQPVIAQVERTD